VYARVVCKISPGAVGYRPERNNVTEKRVPAMKEVSESADIIEKDERAIISLIC